MLRTLRNVSPTYRNEQMRQDAQKQEKYKKLGSKFTPEKVDPLIRSFSRRVSQPSELVQSPHASSRLSDHSAHGSPFSVSHKSLSPQVALQRRVPTKQNESCCSSSSRLARSSASTVKH